jgi:hypothetical protein
MSCENKNVRDDGNAFALNPEEDDLGRRCTNAVGCGLEGFVDRTSGILSYWSEMFLINHGYYIL